MYAVHYYLRYKLSLDNVVEIMAMRGFLISRQTVHNWVQEFGVTLGIQCRGRHKGKCGKK